MFAVGSTLLGGADDVVATLEKRPERTVVTPFFVLTLSWIQRGKLRIRQEGTFGPIYLRGAEGRGADERRTDEEAGSPL